MKNLFLFLFLLVVFTSKAQDNRVSGLNSRQFTKYWKVESESPDYKVTFQGDHCKGTVATSCDEHS